MPSELAKLLKNTTKPKSSDLFDTLTDYVAPPRPSAPETLIPFHAEADRIIELKRQKAKVLGQIELSHCSDLEQETQFHMDDLPLSQVDERESPINSYNLMVSMRKFTTIDDAMMPTTFDHIRKSPACVSVTPGPKPKNSL